MKGTSLKVIKNEIQSLLSGKSQVSHGTLIQTISHYLGTGSPTGPMAQESQQNKREEAEKLIEYAKDYGLWVKDIRFSDFISEGAEQRVFIKDEKHVLKLNDTIYYASWVDYFQNLLLNNFFFTDTAYRFLGFYQQDDVLYAVVEQPFVVATEPTGLHLVKSFMEKNGFDNTRNHDYYHPGLGIILEDLHDENVLTQNGMLYFIDTVFYIRPEVFWS